MSLAWVCSLPRSCICSISLSTGRCRDRDGGTGDGRVETVGLKICGMSRIRIIFTGRKEEWTEGREKEVRHHVVLDAVNDVLFEDVDHEVEGDAESHTYTQMCTQFMG